MDKLQSQIQIPEGYEIVAFELKTGLITFKKKSVERWRDEEHNEVVGYYINDEGKITWRSTYLCFPGHACIFSTKEQAQSALAKAQLSQIIANDPRFGGPVTDEEWLTSDTKYVIYRTDNKLSSGTMYTTYTYLAFHTEEQRDLFLKENEDLIKQYFML